MQEVGGGGLSANITTFGGGLPANSAAFGGGSYSIVIETSAILTPVWPVL